MTKNVVSQAEFSRPVAADQIGPQETQREIVANATERTQLAERFGLLALERLTATLQLKRGRGGVIEAKGQFEADVVQACVVTLEPVPAQLRQSFAVSFGAASAPAVGEVVIGLDDEDPPEELRDGRIDLGEMVSQQLAVALDPYPRAPAADDAIKAAEEAAEGGDAGATAFSALERLRARRN